MSDRRLVLGPQDAVEGRVAGSSPDLKCFTFFFAISQSEGERLARRFIPEPRDALSFPILQELSLAEKYGPMVPAMATWRPLMPPR
jgi:hypothetical protein